jgi:hypothetical protein
MRAKVEGHDHKGASVDTMRCHPEARDAAHSKVAIKRWRMEDAEARPI